MTDEEIARVDARLAVLATYEAGWCDGDGDVIPAAALAQARELALLLPGVSIFGHPDGGVNLEWGHHGPIYWSVEVTGEDTWDAHGIDVAAVHARLPVTVYTEVLTDPASVIAFVTASEQEQARR